MSILSMHSALLYQRFGACALAVVTRKSTIFYTLLLALILSGTIPQGFMRTTSEDGMMLVLCTSEGPSEIWMSADGDILDDAPASDTSSYMSDCLAVTLSLVLVQTWFDTLAHSAEFTPYRLVVVDLRRALVPTHTPLQPRAPPGLI